jgi:hypothetical protein
MAPRKKQVAKLEKATDEVSFVRCVSGDGLIRVEVWKDANGKVVRYNLAFINLHLFAKDNGRVLGYDTAHGTPHRHFAGTIEPIEAASYESIARRFFREVGELKKREHL